MATVATTLNSGTGFVSGETVTATKLNNLVNGATVTGIVDADISSIAAIAGSKLNSASVTPTQLSQPLTRVTSQSTTSPATSVDFTSIPSWAKRITVMLSGVSMSGTASNLLIQLGAGSPTTTGYSSYSMNFGGSGGTGFGYTTGFAIRANANNELYSGLMTITNLSGNAWVAQGSFCGTTANNTGFFSAGGVTLSGTLDRVRITTSGGNTFSAGSVNVMYE